MINIKKTNNILMSMLVSFCLVAPFQANAAIQQGNQRTEEKVVLSQQNFRNLQSEKKNLREFQKLEIEGNRIDEEGDIASITILSIVIVAVVLYIIHACVYSDGAIEPSVWFCLLLMAIVSQMLPAFKKKDSEQQKLESVSEDLKKRLAKLQEGTSFEKKNLPLDEQKKVNLTLQERLARLKEMPRQEKLAESLVLRLPKEEFNDETDELIESFEVINNKTIKEEEFVMLEEILNQ